MTQKSQGGRPPKDAGLVAAGIELVQGGITPEEAAERLTEMGRPISGRTIRRAMIAGGTPSPLPSARTSMAAPTAPPLTVEAPPLPAPVEALPGARPLPAAKLGELRDLVARLPFAQQDALVSTLPLERLRTAAIVRGLAPYHAAAAAVVSELRAVSL